MRQRLPLLLAMAALLLVAVLVSRGGSGVPHGSGLVLDAGPPPPTVSAAPASVQPGAGKSNPAADAILSTAALIILAAFVVFVVSMVSLLHTLSVRRRKRVRLSRAVADTDEDASDLATVNIAALVQGARAAAHLLRQRTGGPPADAVQQAWLIMESAATDSGTIHRPAQTATEFTTVLLAEHVVDQPSVDTLRRLYQRARFGRSDELTETDVTTAIDALERIATELAAEPRVAP